MLKDDLTESNGSPQAFPPSSTPWKPSGPIDVAPEDSAAFIAETCQRMAMVLPHYLVPLYAKQEAVPEDQDPPLELMHIITTLEMTTVGVAMIERSNHGRLQDEKPNLTLLKPNVTDLHGNPLTSA